MPAFIVGVDEAGRGPLAGPVAVGVVALPRATEGSWRPILAEFPFGRDSKKLTVKARAVWYRKLRELEKAGAIRATVAFSSHDYIDNYGIAPAIRRALAEALAETVSVVEDSLVLLDGGLQAPLIYPHQETVIKGDEKILVIGLASILAKVARDTFMLKLAEKYPLYELEKHKGYGTARHCALLRQYGPCEIHRRSFLERILKKV